MDGNGTADIYFTRSGSTVSHDSRTFGSVIQLSGSAPVVDLPTNYAIGPTVVNYSWTGEDGTVFSSTGGPFFGQVGCIGVRFRYTGMGGYYYGWIRFDGRSAPTAGTIVDWAYEDTINSPINAGAIGGGQSVSCSQIEEASPATVPTLNQWGLLALIGLLAGGGAMALRKREAGGSLF